MEIFEVQPEHVVVGLTPREALILSNALNEVINVIGYEDSELSARLGADRSEAEAVLIQLEKVLELIPPFD